MTIPTSLSSRRTGSPDILYLAIIFSTSATEWVSVTVIGSMIIPDSDFLTRSTSFACASMGMFLWMIPSPPSRAMAIAVRCSVTESIAALINGAFNPMVFVSLVARETSLGRT